VEESLVKMNLDVSLSSEKRFIIGLNNNKACDNSEELCSAWIDQHIKLGFMACSVWVCKPVLYFGLHACIYLLVASVEMPMPDFMLYKT